MNQSNPQSNILQDVPEASGGQAAINVANRVPDNCFVVEVEALEPPEPISTAHSERD